MYDLLCVSWRKEKMYMETAKTGFKKGTVVKGSDLKKCILCKILPVNMCMRKFQYQIGMNVDTKSFDLSGECEYGLHFSLIQDVLYGLNYGNEIPKSSPQTSSLSDIFTTANCVP